MYIYKGSNPWFAFITRSLRWAEQINCDGELAGPAIAYIGEQ